MSGLGCYILEGKLAVPVADVITWSRWFETADRVVASDETSSYWISTVFLGLDHSFGGELPILFETMVFTLARIRSPFAELGEREYHDELWCDRCGTWEEAIEMHERGLAHARQLERQLPTIVGGET